MYDLTLTKDFAQQMWKKEKLPDKKTKGVKLNAGDLT